MKKILVIGSSNTDLIAKVKNFPAAGETIEGNSYMQAMGGKGANQAMAAHKLGGDVSFITSLGDDSNGQHALSYYKKEGLEVSSSLIVEDVPSGTTMILVDEKGENIIVISPGANQKLSPSYIQKVEGKIKEADILVLQMEIPYETVVAVCELSQMYKKQLILNVAPARKLEEEILKSVDILLVNETEAETITGEKIELIGKDVVVGKLLSMGAKTAVLTLGKAGCFFKNEQDSFEIRAFTVDAIDTTAAGDTFCGAIAAEIGKGHNWQEALIFASAASAICVTKMGAQPSIPSEQEVNTFLKSEQLKF